MKIRSLCVRNFKIHADRTVEFDDRLTLISGPNEAGKSTLLEALRAAFFLRARGGSREHTALRSQLHAGHPEVRVAFDAGGRSYSIEKVFKGAGGTSLLRERGGQTWRDDEADGRLAELLGVAEARKPEGQWSHLLVGQGHGGDNPVDCAQTQSRNLIRHLQQEGGAAVALSVRDHEVAGHFARLFEETFQKNGEPRATSPLGRAHAAEKEAAASLVEARERCDRLAEAAEKYSSAAQRIASKTQELDRLRPQAETADTEYAAARELERSLRELALEGQGCAEKYDRLAQADAQIRALQQTLEKSQKALAPLEGAQRAAEMTLRDADAKLSAAESAHASAVAAETADRLRCEFADAVVRVIEKKDALRDLEKQAATLEKRRREIQALEEQIARIPAVDAKTLAKLGKLEAATQAASAQFAATATRLRVLEMDTAVRIGDEPLSDGSDLVLTEEIELRIGEGTRILLTPGGAQTLQEAREHQERTAQALREALRQCGQVSVTGAREAAAQRAILIPQQARMAADLEEMRPTEIEAALHEARTECAAAENILASLQGQDPALAPASALPDARAIRGQARGALQQSAAAKSRADAALAIAREARESALKALQKRQREFSEADLARQTAEAQRDLLLQQQGADPIRQKALAEALQERDRAAAAHQSAKDRLEALGIDQLRQNVGRLADSVRHAENALAQARTDKALAEGALRRDGSQDPEADRKRAQILHENARRTLDMARRTAEARRLLHRLFSEHKARIAQEYTRPLVDRINAYLERLFGRGVRAEVVLNDDRLEGINISRETLAGVAFDFDVLSGGTAEQVAAATRLAMAEILANDHDGSLPVVFDDAFTNSDPERVRSLLGMLYLAAENGLQIILLSCDPGAYSGCGAREIHLGGPSPAPGFGGDAEGIRAAKPGVERSDTPG